MYYLIGWDNCKSIIIAKDLRDTENKSYGFDYKGEFVKLLSGENTFHNDYKSIPKPLMLHIYSNELLYQSESLEEVQQRGMLEIL